jgi:hypothetical protein
MIVSHERGRIRILTSWRHRAAPFDLIRYVLLNTIHLESYSNQLKGLMGIQGDISQFVPTKDQTKKRRA